MKFNVKYRAYVIILLLIISATGCNDVLDIENPNAINSSEVFGNIDNFEAYSFSLYAGLVPGWPAYKNPHSEESTSSDQINGIAPVGKFRGEAGTSVPTGGGWGGTYNTIRRINEGLENIPENVSVGEQSRYNRVNGELLIYRAMVYHGLTSAHGGVPLVLKQLNLDDELNLPRNKTSECVAQILKDMNEGIALLPVNGNNDGRLDQAIAKTIKARMMLFYASPIFEATGAVSWQDVYTAAKEAKAACDANGKGLESSYDRVFARDNEKNKEAIWFREYKRGNITSWHTVESVPFAYGKQGTSIHANKPTLDLVEKYPNADGSPYTLQTENDPMFYKDRDPRFYVTIGYPGVDNVYPATPIFTNGQPHRIYPIEGVIGSIPDMLNGFYLTKGVATSDSDLTPDFIDQDELDWIEIRYAEVLLMIAEAAAETNKPQEAIDILRQIRARAGITMTPNNYGIDGGLTGDALVKAVLDERLLEFAFENKREWDLRRRKMYETELVGKRLHGLFIKIADAANFDPTVPYEDNYPYLTVSRIERLNADIQWHEKLYYEPVSEAVIGRNPSVQQSAVWGGQFNILD